MEMRIMNKYLRAAKALRIKESIWKIEMEIMNKELSTANDNLNNNY